MEHPTGPPLVIARGGASAEAPEHTIAAFEAALDEGADALSLRVRLSRDGHPVAFGPATLERTTDGRGTVGECTVRELKRLDAGGWKGLSFRGQRVQTLQEVLEAADVEQIRAAGLGCYVWTVNEPVLADRLVGWRVDGILTDRPGLVRARISQT